MSIEHACFISFPKGNGKDSQFANHFYNEFTEQLAAIDKNLSVFKYDRCEHRRRGDDWTLWIQRELCDSAMMIAVCAPNYFNGSQGCISEFKGMEALIIERTNALGELGSNNWLLGLRLKDKIPMPALNSYDVRDFLDCCASPEKVRRTHKYRKIVEELADRVYNHWCWLHRDGRNIKLVAANICANFVMPSTQPAPPDPFPYMGAVP
ncbi:hypothetical protein PJI16_08950 [Nitrospira sp. MA-1]|nr:hypothetical protein [Nitrospira sp. MA-1]